jgi:hypothetical protein
MADDKKLIYTLVIQNEKFQKEAQRSKNQIMSLEKAAGQSIGQIRKNFSTLNTTATQNLSKFGKSANDSFGMMGRSAGQAGVQLQQFIGQVQGGTNPLLAFSQQAADVGIVLGAPMLGAIAGIVGAIGMSLLPKLFESVDALKKLEIASKSVQEILKINEAGVISLADEFGKLAASANVLSEAKIKTTLQDISEAMSEANKEALDLAKSLSPSELGGRFGRVSLLVGIAKNKFIEGKISLEEFNAELNRLYVQAETPTTAFKDVIKDIGQIAEEAKKLKEAQGILEGGVGGISTESAVKQAEEAAKEQQELSQNETKQANDYVNGLQDRFFALSDSLRSEEQVLRDTYNERLGIIEEFNRQVPGFEAEANETRLALQEDFNTKMDALDKRRLQSSQDFISSRLAILASAFGEETALGKTFFAAQQALAIAQGIVSTELAAAQALAALPGPAGVALSGVIRGLGYASVGVIAGQTIASFEGGGVTPSGPRSGGMDGKGGKLAMLHPNEKVIDLNKGGAANDVQWNVVINNNSQSVVTQTIDEEKRIVGIMVEQAKNQSSPFRNAMHQTSNMTPRGVK